MRRRIPSALLLTALAATSVAAATPHSSDAQGSQAAVPQPHRLIEALSPEVGEELELADVIDARRAAYAMTPGVTPLFSEGPAERPAPSEHATVVAPPMDWVYAAPDLDGDGRDDLFVWSHDEGSATVHARRGIDGQELWAFEPIADAWFDPYGLPDVTGDGIEDILLTGIIDGEWDSSYTLEAGPDGEAPRYESIRTWTNVTQLRSGRDGAVLYHDEREATSRYLDEEHSREAATPLESDTESWRLEMRSDDVLSWLLPSDDHDGDGIVDLVELVVSAEHLSEGSSEDGPVQGYDEQSTRETGAALARVMSATGETIWAPSDAATDRYGWLLPAGDLDGDQISDLLWVADGDTDLGWRCDRTLVLSDCSSHDDSDEHSRYVTSFRGADLSVFWETDSTRTDEIGVGFWGVSPLLVDVDGDGSDDLLAGSVALAGADASVLWDRSDIWQGLVPLGTDAHGGLLLLAVDQAYVQCTEDPSAYVERVAMTRIDGRDGSTGLETELMVGSCEHPGHGWVELVGDHDADGLRDLVLNTWTSTGDGMDQDYEAFLETATGERTPGLGVDRFVESVPDLDGDGADDLLVRAYGYDQGNDDDVTVALADLGSRELWRIGSTDGRYAYPQFLGDVDGDGGADVAVHEGRYDRHGGLDWIRIARGSDLSTLWTGAVERRGPATHDAR